MQLGSVDWRIRGRACMHAMRHEEGNIHGEAWQHGSMNHDRLSSIGGTKCYDRTGRE